MTKRKLPDEFIEARPALLNDPLVQHPSTGMDTSRLPAKYTLALHEAIVDKVKRGYRPHVAAAEAGITSNTFYSWMRLGREGHVHLVQFAEDIEQALAIAEGKMLDAIVGPDKEGQIDPDNAKWYLERQRASGYSKEVQTKVDALLGEFLERLRDGLTPQEYQKVLLIAGGHDMTPQRAQPIFLTQKNGSEEEVSED